MLIIMIITASLSLTTCRLQAVSQCEVVLVGGLSVKVGSQGFSLMTMSMISGYCHRKQKENAVEPTLQTPAWYGYLFIIHSFVCSDKEKAHICCIKLTSLIQTPG